MASHPGGSSHNRPQALAPQALIQAGYPLYWRYYYYFYSIPPDFFRVQELIKLTLITYTKAFDDPLSPPTIPPCKCLFPLILSSAITGFPYRTA